MRIFIFLLFVTTISSFSYANDSQILESLVSCERNYEIINFIKNIDSNSSFKSSGGNFYEQIKELKAFGHKILYLGLHGVDMVPGPNITINGDFNSTKNSIIKKINKKFECGPEGCGSAIGSSTQIMIYPHLTNKKLTIIQCGYFGP